MLETNNFESGENGVTQPSSPDANNQNSNANIEEDNKHLFNKSKELERKLEQANAMLSELKSIKKQEKEKSIVDREQFLTTLAKRTGFVDVDGVAQIDEVSKIVNLIQDFNASYIEPKFAQLTSKEVISGLPDYSEYKDDIDNIIENELSDTEMPNAKKIKIAYEMARGRRPITNVQNNQQDNNNSFARPANANKSSVNSSMGQKVNKIPTDIHNEFKAQAKNLGIPLESIEKEYWNAQKRLGLA